MRQMMRLRHQARCRHIILRVAIDYFIPGRPQDSSVDILVEFSVDSADTARALWLFVIWCTDFFRANKT